MRICMVTVKPRIKQNKPSNKSITPSLPVAFYFQISVIIIKHCMLLLFPFITSIKCCRCCCCCYMKQLYNRIESSKMQCVTEINVHQ